MAFNLPDVMNFKVKLIVQKDKKGMGPGFYPLRIEWIIKMDINHCDPNELVLFSVSKT